MPAIGVGAVMIGTLVCVMGGRSSGWHCWGGSTTNGASKTDDSPDSELISIGGGASCGPSTTKRCPQVGHGNTHDAVVPAGRPPGAPARGRPGGTELDMDASEVRPWESE